MNKFARVNQQLNSTYDLLSEYEMIPARDIENPIKVDRLKEVSTKDGPRLAAFCDKDKKFFFLPVSFIRIVNELLEEDPEATVESLIDEPLFVKFEKIQQQKDSKKTYIKTIIC